MKAALRLLLAPYRFSVDRLFRMGEVGGAHWFTDPNSLYRRRNLLTYTGGSYASPWATDNSGATNPTVTTNYAAAPDGTMTAARVQLNKTGGVFSRLGYVVSWPTGRQYVVSVYARTTSGSGTANVGLRGGDAAGTNMAVTGTWQRFTYALGTITSPADFQILLWDNIAGNDETADILIWGAQLELGSSATEYQAVPTTWPQAYLDAVGAENIFAWTDSAGTTPVTAVGDTIGLSLDRAYGGMRGPELRASGVVGVVGSATVATYNTSTGAGTATRVDASNQSFVVLGGFGANGMAELSITNTGAVTINVRITDQAGAIPVTVSAGATVSARIATAANGNLYITSSSAASIAFTVNSARAVPGTHLIQATGTARPTLSARVNALLNTATMSTQNVTTIAASYKLSFTGTGTVTLSGTSTDGPLVGTGANDRVSLTFTPTAGTLTLTVSGSVTLADLRTADDAAKNIPAYQRVGATAANHDTDGFPHGQYPDGTDDNQTTTTGGGGTTGFFYCGAITVSGGAGTARTIWSDTGTNTGYRVRINSSNKLELAAGNGSAYTTVESNETITALGTYILSAWDDGGVLAVQVNNFAAATTTRPSVSAGTSTATMYKDNGAASSYLNGRDYGSVYRQSYIGESQHARLKRWLADLASITL